LTSATGLAQLKAGRIDAVVYVSGYPVRVLNDQLTSADGLALIPITNKRVFEMYGEIPAEQLQVADDAYQDRDRQSCPRVGVSRPRV
jgi:TRAP-type uncharacterized transport system substrate-binding protein